MPNFAPGKSDSIASAIRWAELCQYARFPSSSFHVRILTEASDGMGRARSHVSPFTATASASRARPRLMLSATCRPVTPRS